MGLGAGPHIQGGQSLDESLLGAWANREMSAALLRCYLSRHCFA